MPPVEVNPDLICVDPLISSGCESGNPVTVTVSESADCLSGTLMTVDVQAGADCTASLLINNGQTYDCVPGQQIPIELVNCCGTVRWMSDQNVTFASDTANPTTFALLDSEPHTINWECCS